MPDDIHERVARDAWYASGGDYNNGISEIAKVLRRKYGPMTDMHTAADEAAKVWMERAQKDECEIDTLNAKLAKAREALELIGGRGPGRHLYVSEKCCSIAREALAAMWAKDGGDHSADE